MSLTKKHFEEIADIIATAKTMNLPHVSALYMEQRLIEMCDKHGHNFNKSIFLKRIQELEQELNNEKE